MIYRHQFVVRAPLAAVVAFHQQASSLAAITPPPISVELHAVPPRLSEGDSMNFTLWLGPLPLRWQAQIEQVTPISFADRQLSGPFAHWLHLHTFLPVDAQTTVVSDRITAELHPRWPWRLVGLGMWRTLPLLFAYRAWQTRRLLGASWIAALPLENEGMVDSG